MLRLLSRILACALLYGSAYAQDHSDRRHQYFEWRMLGEHDEFGRIPLDAHTIASEQRKALVIKRPPASLPATPRYGVGGAGPEAAIVAPEAAGIAPPQWTALGPSNIGGRIRSIVIHPTNPQKI